MRKAKTNIQVWRRSAVNNQHLGDRVGDGRIILKWNFGKRWYGKVYAENCLASLPSYWSATYNVFFTLRFKSNFTLFVRFDVFTEVKV
jgi:hypothetical protein